MGPRHGRLWSAVALCVTTVGSIAGSVGAQAGAAQSLKVSDLNIDKNGQGLSPLGNQVHQRLQNDHHGLVRNDEARLKHNNKEPPLAHFGHQALNSVGKAPKRRVISKREAKKPKNTKRRKKFNKKEFEMRLQQQKDEERSGLKKNSEGISTVDTSEVLSSSNSLVPESGKDSSGSSSTYESYSDTSDSSDKNDIDDSDDDEEEEGDSDEKDSSEVSDDKTESTEEIPLTSEEKSSDKPKTPITSADVSLSSPPDSGPDSSPPASSDSTDESSGSKAISGSSSEYSEISYTMSSSAEDAFPVEDSSSEETKEKEVDTSKDNSKSKEKSKSSSSKSVKSAKKAKLKTGAKKKTRKGDKRLKLNRKKGGKSKLQDDKHELNPSRLDVEGHKNDHPGSNDQKLSQVDKHAQRLEMTTGKVLNMAEQDVKHEKHLDQDTLHFQVTTERVLRMVQNAAHQNGASRSAAGGPSSSGSNGLSNHGVPHASRERPAMEMLKVKKAVIDPNKKEDLEQELLKDYPENGTVEIINYEGTFAPIHGEPYVAPLHHQPDEFWDAIYTSKDPDLPTPPGADISGEMTEHPIPAPGVHMRRLAPMTNNHPGPHIDTVYSENIHKIEAKDKDKGKKDKKNKKAPKLTIKEKRKKKKEKKENPNALKAAGKIVMSGATQHHPEIHPSEVTHRDFVSHENAQIHPHLTAVGSNFPGKAEPHVQNIAVKVHAKDKSEEVLKTPSEEERESGTTYKPEGAYEWPSFRHPDFDPDTAYDEHGIPIHESPGWTPPPTLPGDNRFGKGRNQAGAGMKNKDNGLMPMSKVALKQMPIKAPKILAAKVADPKYSLHPEDKLANNFHGLQEHLALLEHQKAVEAHGGLHSFNPLHPLQSNEHNMKLPLQHLQGVQLGQPVHRIRKREAPESLESLESISELLDTAELKVSPPTLHDQEAAKEQAYGGTRATRLTKQAWLKNISLSRLRPTGTTTKPPKKEPYTGFLLTQRPRWFHQRGPRFEPHPVVPPHHGAPHTPTVHPTKLPVTHLSPPTTMHPPESSTQWWPRGVLLGSQPPVSRIPVGVIYPEIGRWEFDWSKVKIRTSGTRYTYAPEVVNYPITLDWHVPRHLRTEKWTQRPDWPLESPLFSSEAYDYLEEPTLPRILESGETEYPPTSPLPWWTYPPWWLEKKALESVNGTTPRPYKRKTPWNSEEIGIPTTRKVIHVDEYNVRDVTESGRTSATSKTEGEIKLSSKEVELKTVKETKVLDVGLDKTTFVPSGDKLQHKQEKLRRKTQHKGPWWHLTIVEHLTTKRPSEEYEGNGRAKRSPKLVRQNAFRRKWRKLRQRKNLSYTLDLKQIKPVRDESESPSIKRVLSNYTFSWPKVNDCMNLTNNYIEDFLTKALEELKVQVNHIAAANQKTPSDTQIESQIEKHLIDLYNTFFSVLSNFSHNQGSNILFHIVTNEIGQEMLKQLLNHTNSVRGQLEELLTQADRKASPNEFAKHHLEKSRFIHLFHLLCKFDLILPDTSDKITNIFQTIFGKELGDLFKCHTIHKSSLNIEKQLLKTKIISNQKENLEENHFFRKKREDIVDITESPFNLSSGSVERVVSEIVDEMVEELPIDEIHEEVKHDVITGYHENQLKRLGKTNINQEVLREMIKLESADDTKLRNTTEASVRRVIMKMVNTILNTLRQNPWMRDLLIKLFEEGYSVDSVLDTISDQISVDELMKSLEKDGINITNYQRKLVLDEFKDYRSTLKKMLTREVQLWEYQLSKNQTLVRHKRDLSEGSSNEHVIDTSQLLSYNHVGMKAGHYEIKNNNPEHLRMKRNVNDNEISKSDGEQLSPDIYDENDMDIDKELAELKKSSMSKREKMKVLKKRLKGLLSETENPDDIVFPDNFEEELMRTENFYDEEVTQSPQRFKQRIRWHVRTKKPTTKVITYPMKIRLNRGRPFVPLTTTEEQTLIVVVTKAPVRKYRTKKLVPTKKVVPATKKPVAPATPTLKKHFWLDFTTAPTNYEISKSQKIILKPIKTFATLRTFKTMKFIQKTKQPVISLQEFLKRRNEFRREKQEEMFNRPWSEEDKKSRSQDTKSLSDLSEEEEEFSFEAKLSGEISPSTFTFPPSFLITEPTKTTIDRPSTENQIVPTSDDSLTPPLSSKATRRKATRRKTATRSNKTRAKKSSTKENRVTGKPSINLTEVSENMHNVESSRRKRDLNVLQTATDPTKTEVDINDVTIPASAVSNDKLRTNESNLSQNFLESKIYFHNLSYKPKQSKEARNFAKNMTDSFETYQQEHKKWFGTKRRGVPVNNFDIDWEQMRRRMEIHQMSAWMRQKSSYKPTSDGKQPKRIDRLATPLTQATTPIVMDSAEKPSSLLDTLYKSALKKTKTKSSDKYYTSGENTDSRIKDYIPFGRMERDGQTAFGRLYQGKKHYQVEDLRDKHFEESDLQQFVNKTYDPDFRISTHRKSNWENRTYDPNYVFTQFVPFQKKTKKKVRFSWKEAMFENENQTNNPIYSEKLYVKYPALAENDSLSKTHRPTTKPYKNYLEDEHVTEVINEGNDTYIFTRSKRVPWENNTDIETYKKYIWARKKFYNKTLDIAFSYYIFHKFRCGNKTRDLGYGRMSNVVNRWYNKTFIPKYRPDMFYVRNMYKRGKEFNLFKDEMNEVHAIISYGDFDPYKWMQVATEVNLEESNRTKSDQIDESHKKEKKKRIIEVFSAVFPSTTQVPKTYFTQFTASWKESITTEPTRISTTKASFFQAVKKKGFGFFKSLFGKQDSSESKD